VMNGHNLPSVIRCAFSGLSFYIPQSRLQALAQYLG
jgi:hypothetical protein